MLCPCCSANDFYQGFTDQDCKNPECKLYKPRYDEEEKVEEKEESEIVYNPCMDIVSGTVTGRVNAFNPSPFNPSPFILTPGYTNFLKSEEIRILPPFSASFSEEMAANFKKLEENLIASLMPVCKKPASEKLSRFVSVYNLYPKEQYRDRLSIDTRTRICSKCSSCDGDVKYWNGSEFTVAYPYDCKFNSLDELIESLETKGGINFDDYKEAL